MAQDDALGSLRRLGRATVGEVTDNINAELEAAGRRRVDPSTTLTSLRRLERRGLIRRTDEVSDQGAIVWEACQ